MVSLRERRSRPSYSNFAEGLDILSDASSEGNPRSKSGGAKDDDDTQSLSSGDASAFKVSDDERVLAESGGDDSELDEPRSEPSGDDDPADEGDSDPDIAIDENVISNPIPRRATKKPLKSSVKVGAPKRASKVKHEIIGEGNLTRVTAQAYSSSSLNTLPRAYRDLLRTSATILVRPTAGDHDTEQAHLPRYRAPSGLIACGPVVPFTTRLASRPSPRDPVEIVTEREESEWTDIVSNRRQKQWKDLRTMGVLSPWETWQGEGWWPGMYRAGGSSSASGNQNGSGSKIKAKVKSKGKGKGKEMESSTWIARDEVRLGLDSIAARYQVLTRAQGDTYLVPSPPVPVHVGPLHSQERVIFNTFDSTRTRTQAVTTRGFLLAAGGPVWGLDWCPYPDRLVADNGYAQYLAVSSLHPDHADVKLGGRGPAEARGAIQIWSVLPPADTEDADVPLPEGRATCELVICFTGGPAMELKWMPLGAWDESNVAKPKLGIIAAVQLDGTVSLYAVPHPRSVKKGDGPVFVSVDPLLKLNVSDTACLCIDWVSGGRLAAGLANGHLAVWDVLDAIREGGEDPLPSMYITLAVSSIRSIAAGRCPPSDAQGGSNYEGEVPYVAFASYSGSTGVVDLRDPLFAVELCRGRLPSMGLAWSTQVVAPIFADADYSVMLGQLRSTCAPVAQHLMPHRGPVWDIATSDYHTMVASASSDGSVNVVNCGTGFWRRKKVALLFQRIYEVDYDIHTGEYRMIDGFAPEMMGVEESTGKSRKKNKGALASSKGGQAPIKGDVAAVKTAAWPRQAGIHRVTWQSGGGLGRAGWLASAGASGIVRVDWVEGTFLRK